MAELVQMAKGMNVEGAAGLRKQELMFALLQTHAATGPVFGEGVLECMPDGFGFLRAPDYIKFEVPEDVMAKLRSAVVAGEFRWEGPDKIALDRGPA